MHHKLTAMLLKSFGRRLRGTNDDCTHTIIITGHDYLEIWSLLEIYVQC